MIRDWYCNCHLIYAGEVAVILNSTDVAAVSDLVQSAVTVPSVVIHLFSDVTRSSDTIQSTDIIGPCMRDRSQPMDIIDPCLMDRSQSANIIDPCKGHSILSSIPEYST